MTSTVNLETLSNPHNLAKKTEVFQKASALTQSAAAPVQMLLSIVAAAVFVVDANAFLLTGDAESLDVC